MEVVEERNDNVVILKLSGRLDASSSKEMKDKIAVLVKGDAKDLILDMSEVSFIDSSGLGSVVAALRSVHKVGGDIKIAALQEKVMAIFKLTRLHHVFEIFDDCESAAQAF